MIKSVKKHNEEQNLRLNAKKTKIMSSDKTQQATYIIIGNDLIKEVVDFDYLGSQITNTGNKVK